MNIPELEKEPIVVEQFVATEVAAVERKELTAKQFFLEHRAQFIGGSLFAATLAAVWLFAR